MKLRREACDRPSIAEVDFPTGSVARIMRSSIVAEHAVSTAIAFLGGGIKSVRRDI
jgi:hypothetical protein